MKNRATSKLKYAGFSSRLEMHIVSTEDEKGVICLCDRKVEAEYIIMLCNREGQEGETTP